MKQTPRASCLVILLLGGLLLFGCVSTGSQKTQSAPHKDSSFQKAHGLYVNGRYEQASETFTDILRSKSERGNESLFARSYQYRGLCRKAVKEFGLARFDFDLATKVAKGSSGTFPDRLKLITECRIAKGDTYMFEGTFRSADRIFKEILESRPPKEYRDGLYYRRYICAVKLGESQPEKYLARIENERSFDKKTLAREFLGSGSHTPIRDPKPREFDRPIPSAGPTVLLSRADWNARPTKSNVNRMTLITKITVHHTAMYWDSTDKSATAGHIRQIQKNHQGPPSGWADIGYHFLIDRSGRVWEGRPLVYQGAHAGSPELNKGNIGICLLGNFETQKLTSGQKDGLLNLLNALCGKYGLSRSRQILTHKELRRGYTECPGEYLQGFMDQWRITG